MFALEVLVLTLRSIVYMPDGAETLINLILRVITGVAKT
jgi:hypothetical protein